MFLREPFSEVSLRIASITEMMFEFDKKVEAANNWSQFSFTYMSNRRKLHYNFARLKSNRDQLDCDNSLMIIITIWISILPALFLRTFVLVLLASSKVDKWKAWWAKRLHAPRAKNWWLRSKAKCYRSRVYFPMIIKVWNVFWTKRRVFACVCTYANCTLLWGVILLQFEQIIILLV